MSAYESMTLLINNAITKLNKGKMTQEEFELFKEESMKKLDTFLTCNRVTSSNYEELHNLMETATENAA